MSSGAGDTVFAALSAVNNADGNGVLSIVGRTATAAGDKKAALWNTTAAGNVLGLTSLGAVPFTNPGAVAVNDDGLVILTRPARVFIPGLGLTPLPLDGTVPVGSEAYGVNNLGDVVGTIYDNDAGHDVGVYGTSMPRVTSAARSTSVDSARRTSTTLE